MAFVRFFRDDQEDQGGRQQGRQHQGEEQAAPVGLPQGKLNR